MGSNRLRDDDVDFINKSLGKSVSAHCDSCYWDELRVAHEKWPGRTADTDARKSALTTELNTHLAAVPILSLQCPMGWDYEPISIVTAQSVTGTGVFADVGSIFTDMFGLQSGMFRNKLRTGEDLCKASLRLEAVRVGGHAVIGVDVDYADVGGARSMLMVCMTGTAVRLHNFDRLEPSAAKSIARAQELTSEIAGLSL